ncbi:MAG: efflux RND transporter periplasmic adaptor subunit [Candidatus Muiribacteriota bacterium]
MKKNYISAIIFSGLILFSTGCQNEKKEIEVKPVTVKVENVEVKNFVNSINIPVTVFSKETVNVSAKNPGIIEKIHVEEGSHVKASETLLFESENYKLQQAVNIAIQNVELAEISLDEKKITLERLKAEYENALIEKTRHESLFKQKAVSQSILDDKILGFQKADSAYKLGQVLLELSQQQYAQAQTNLNITQKTYEDSTIFAPISGIVTKKYIDAGEMGSPGMPVISIVNVNNLELKGNLPAIYYEKVTPGETQVVVEYGNNEFFESKVSYKSFVIDPMLRTFEIKSDISEISSKIVPGQLLKLSVIFEKFESLAVPAESILIRNNKNVIFVTSGKKAKLVEVEKGLTYRNYTQLKNLKLSQNEKVITEGQFLLNEGSSISILAEGR